MIESLEIADIERIVLKESQKIRVKVLRQLIEMYMLYRKGEITTAEDIVDRYHVSFRTAYDYFNTLELLKILHNSQTRF